MRRSIPAALALLALAGGAPLAAQQDAGDALIRAEHLYEAGDNDAALQAVRTALQQSPSDGLATAWEELVLLARGEARAADDLVVDHGYDPQWGTTLEILSGLWQWREGGMLNADGRFSLCQAGAPAYESCRRLRAAARAGDAAPPLSRWAELAGLPAATAARGAQRAASPAPDNQRSAAVAAVLSAAEARRDADGLLAHAALLAARDGDMDGALAAVEASLAQSPRDGLALAWKQAILLQKGDVRGAERIFGDADVGSPWATTIDVLSGLTQWRQGSVLNAGGRFSLCQQGQRAFESCRKLRASLNAGDAVPPLTSWVRLSELGTSLAERLSRQAAAPTPQPTAPVAPTHPARPAPQPERPAPAAPSAPARAQFRVGEQVLVRAAGHLYQPATIRKLADPADRWTAGSYDVVFASGLEEWVWHEDVYRPQRDASWTSRLMGDWDVHVPMSVVTKTDGHNVYDVYAGGLRLPPLRISPDGTYSWASGKRRIGGRWIARPDAPGVILLAGDEGADWTVWLANSSSTATVLKRDEIQMDAPGKVYQEAWRAQPKK